MKSMKHILALVLVLAMAFSLAACGGGDNSKGDNDKVVVGMIISDLTNEFFVTLTDGAKEKAAEFGYEILSMDSANDASVEMTNMEDMISRKPDVIVYNPVDADAAVSAMALANDAGIPVITVDRSANGGDVISHIASDNVFGGKIAGEYIVEQLGEKGGKVVEIQGQPGASAANERGEGFHQAVDNIADIEVVVSQTGNWDKAEAMAIMENALTANPDIKAVFCHNDVMALGVMEACINLGRDDIIIVGFDADPTAVKAIEDGTMAATVQQLPALMGSTAIDVVNKYLKGASIESNIGVEVSLITSATFR